MFRLAMHSNRPSFRLICAFSMMVARVIGGPALGQTALGNPLDAPLGGSGTAYSLCLYDQSDQLAGGLRIDRAGALCGGHSCWQPIGRAPNDPHGLGKGYRFIDPSLASDGVLKMLYSGGGAGQSKLILKGKGPSLPAGLASALGSSAHVTVQLRSSDGVCVTLPLTDVLQQESDIFHAK